MSTNTLSRILSTPHFELLGNRRTWVTPYQEVPMSRSTPNQMMHLKDEDNEKSCLLGILNIITKSRQSSKSSNGAKNAKPIPHTT